MKSNSKNSLNNDNIKWELIDSLKDLGLHLNNLNNQISFYCNEMHLLEKNKPSIFQKRRFREYIQNFYEYKEKINDISLQINDTIDLMDKLHKEIINAEIKKGD